MLNARSASNVLAETATIDLFLRIRLFQSILRSVAGRRGLEDYPQCGTSKPERLWSSIRASVYADKRPVFSGH